MGVFLRLFGGLQLEVDGRAAAGRAIQKKRLALLALLGATPTGRLSRDKLTAFLWPESDVDRARHQLASSVYELRKALGEGAIVSSGDDLLLDRTRVSSDVAAFEDALAAGDRGRAAGLYAGPFLDGFFVADAPELERWIEGERARLAQAYAKALEALARESATGGDAVGAVEWWRKLATLDPFSGRIALRLIEALDAAGDRAGALQHAQLHAAAVRGEIGVEPDPEVTALAGRLRAAAAGARPSGLAGTATQKRRVQDAGTPLEPGLVLEPEPVPRPSRPRRPRRVWMALVAGAAAAAIVAVMPGAVTDETPVVLMIDSPHPALVYDQEVADADGTNADVINDVLRDLPVRRLKEAAGPYWHRHEEIRELKPDLVLIHLSAFCSEQCEPHRLKMRTFIEYLADTDTRFLIYSRKQPDQLALELRDMLGNLPERFPGLSERIYTFSVRAHGSPHWKDPATAAAFKLQVKELLALR